MISICCITHKITKFHTNKQVKVTTLISLLILISLLTTDFFVKKAKPLQGNPEVTRSNIFPTLILIYFLS